MTVAYPDDLYSIRKPDKRCECIIDPAPIVPMLFGRRFGSLSRPRCKFDHDLLFAAFRREESSGSTATDA